MPPPSESSFVSKKEGWKTASKRYNKFEMEGVGMNMMKEKRKRVMVVVDECIHSKHAMLWALTHVANKGDMLTLLEIQNIIPSSSNEDANHLVTSLGTLCKACKPEVEVEALVVQGPMLATVVNQVKNLEVSALVLGQNNSSPFLQCLGMMSRTEKFVDECINNVECLTIGVRKQSRGIGGYLISTRWRKDFWLLA
nr:adenine nucleotide alpha hydrolases-like superfamily protein [Tanacetum cinerariifolium]